MLWRCPGTTTAIPGKRSRVWGSAWASVTTAGTAAMTYGKGSAATAVFADAIGIEPGETDDRLPGKAAFSPPFIRKETVRELLEPLPEQLTADLDVGTLRKLPGNCIDWDEDVREIWVDAPWGVDYLPGRRKRSGTLVLMVEVLSHPYPRVAQRLRRYASMLSSDLCRAGKHRGKASLDHSHAAVRWTSRLDAALARSGVEQIRVHVRGHAPQRVDLHPRRGRSSIDRRD